MLIMPLVLICWGVAFAAYLPSPRRRGHGTTGMVMLLLGEVVLLAYMSWLWRLLGRPPMRTIPETLLWLALLLPLIGLMMESRWRARLSLLIAVVIGVLVLIGLCFMPATDDNTMMPALRSPWFAPHVLLYMTAYATLCIAMVGAISAVVKSYRRRDIPLTPAVDEGRRLVYFAFPLMTAGMLLGAYWAKLAWGHYWTWDPKETLAFISWTVYLAYLHLDRFSQLSARVNLIAIALAFPVVLFCWLVVNVLPSAQSSIHTYGN